jgi:hypothetical protein
MSTYKLSQIAQRKHGMRKRRRNDYWVSRDMKQDLLSLKIVSEAAKQRSL